MPRRGAFQPQVTVSVETDWSGLEAFRAFLPFAIRLAATRLARAAVESWRRVVAVRTGQMRDSLAWRVFAMPSGTAVVIDFAQTRSGFYYRFQRRAPQWTRHLEDYVRANGPAFLRREVRRILGVTQ